MKINKNILLIGILIIAAILRLWNLANVPPSLTPDEAALGYNAYSILKTGKDEYGEFLPVIFKSFGDYKPGLYVYLTVPFVAILGLNEWSVRLPSAIAGVWAVYLIYQIAKHLFVPKSKYNKIFPLMPICSAFILAISPWHIHFSRGAWEINISLTLTLLGVLFYIQSFEKPVKIVYSAVFFALTLLTYQGAKLSTFFVVLCLTIAYFNETITVIKKHTTFVVLSFILGLIISLPILFSFFNNQTGRLTVFSIFSYPRPEKYLSDFLAQANEKVGDVSYYAFHSESVNFLRGIMGRWYNHYSGRFLFFEGDWQNLKHSAPYHGVLTSFDLLLFILGIYYLARNIRRKPLHFLGLWLLLAPLPAALSRDAIHAVRAYSLVIPLTVVLAFGLSWLVTFISSAPARWVKYSATTLVSSAFLLSYVYFIDMYFVHLPIHTAKAWDYGYKQIVQTIDPIKDDYLSIRVQQSYAQPYIYFLFYMSYDPNRYQKMANLSSSEYINDVGFVTKLDNIEFVSINWPEDRGRQGVLFVGDDMRIPVVDSQDIHLFNEIKKIYYPDGTLAYRIVGVK